MTISSWQKQKLNFFKSSTILLPFDRWLLLLLLLLLLFLFLGRGPVGDNDLCKGTITYSGTLLQGTRQEEKFAYEESDFRSY